MLGKLFSDSIEQIDTGPREGVVASGAGRLQEITTGILPQVIPSFIAISLYRLDINFRASTLLGLVGAGGPGEPKGALPPGRFRKVFAICQLHLSRTLPPALL